MSHVTYTRSLANDNNGTQAVTQTEETVNSPHTMGGKKSAGRKPQQSNAAGKQTPSTANDDAVDAAMRAMYSKSKANAKSKQAVSQQAYIVGMCTGILVIVLAWLLATSSSVTNTDGGSRNDGASSKPAAETAAEAAADKVRDARRAHARRAAADGPRFLTTPTRIVKAKLPKAAIEFEAKRKADGNADAQVDPATAPSTEPETHEHEPRLLELIAEYHKIDFVADESTWEAKQIEVLEEFGQTFWQHQLALGVDGTQTDDDYKLLGPIRSGSFAKANENTGFTLAVPKHCNRHDTLLHIALKCAAVHRGQMMQQVLARGLATSTSADEVTVQYGHRLLSIARLLIMSGRFDVIGGVDTEYGAAAAAIAAATGGGDVDAETAMQQQAAHGGHTLLLFEGEPAPHAGCDAYSVMQLAARQRQRQAVQWMLQRIAQRDATPARSRAAAVMYAPASSRHSLSPLALAVVAHDTRLLLVMLAAVTVSTAKMTGLDSEGDPAAVAAAAATADAAVDAVTALSSPLDRHGRDLCGIAAVVQCHECLEMLMAHTHFRHDVSCREEVYEAAEKRRLAFARHHRNSHRNNGRRAVLKGTGGWAPPPVPLSETLPSLLSPSSDDNDGGYEQPAVVQPCSLPIVHARENGMTSELFETEFLSLQRPVILRGAHKHWPTFKAWTRRMFATNRYSGVDVWMGEVPLAEAIGRRYGFTRLSEFTTYMTESAQVMNATLGTLATTRKAAVAAGSVDDVDLNGVTLDDVVDYIVQSVAEGEAAADAEYAAAVAAAGGEGAVDDTVKRKPSQVTVPRIVVDDHITSREVQHDIGKLNVMRDAATPWETLYSHNDLVLGGLGSGSSMTSSCHTMHSLVHGRTQWWLAPSALARDSNLHPAHWLTELRDTGVDGAGRGTHVQQCQQEAGDVLLVPHGWAAARMHTRESISVQTVHKTSSCL